MLATLLLTSAMAAPSFELGPGIVVSPSSSSVYVMADGARIEALDVGTGKVQWTSEAAEVPLAVVDDALVAMRAEGGLTLIVLDSSDGTERGQCGSLEVPVGAGIDQGLGMRFDTHAEVDGDDVIVHWSVRTWYSGGAAPPPEIEAAARSHTTGALRCTPATGANRVETPAVEDAPTAPTASVLTDAGLPVPETFAWAGQSVDGEHMLVAFRTLPENRYDTQLIGLATGSVLLTTPSGSYGHPFVVVEGIVLQVGAPTEGYRAVVTAQRVSTGERTWEHGFRDTSYTGPYPP
jgi:hypothetical protein